MRGRPGPRPRIAPVFPFFRALDADGRSTFFLAEPPLRKHDGRPSENEGRPRNDDPDRSR